MAGGAAGLREKRVTARDPRLHGVFGGNLSGSNGGGMRTDRIRREGERLFAREVPLRGDREETRIARQQLKVRIPEFGPLGVGRATVRTAAGLTAEVLGKDGRGHSHVRIEGKCALLEGARRGGSPTEAPT